MFNRKLGSNKKAFVQLGTMILLTIIIQGVNLLKLSVTASSFGIGIQMDAFNFSNSIGTFIFSFIGTGITTILIPNFIKNTKKETVNTFITVLYLFAFIIFLLVYLNRLEIIRLFSNEDTNFIIIANNVMLITLITQFIDSFSGVTNAVFQCQGKFNFPKFINLFTMILLVVLINFIPNLNIYKFATYILITVIINLIIQVILSVKGGFRYNFKLDIKNPDFIIMLKSFGPTVLSTGLYQISIITDTMISATLGTGQISILSYSNSIIGMVTTLLLGNIMIYFYPKIAKSILEEKDHKKLFDFFILINAIMCLIVVGFFVVGKDGIRILYERGKFTSSVTDIVFKCSLIYIIGLPINAMRDLIYRYFYAKGDTMTPFKNSIIISILNIVFSLILSRFIGVYGIILGTVITSYISLGMILYRFKIKYSIQYNVKNLILENFKIVFTTCISILIITFLIKLLPDIGILLRIICYGITSIVMFSVILYKLKSKVFKVKL